MSQHISANKVAVSRPSGHPVDDSVRHRRCHGSERRDPNDDVPALKVRYTAEALDTDHGAKVLYTRLGPCCGASLPRRFQRQPFGQLDGPTLPRPGRRPGGASNQ
jgi:hypothetical protein